MAALHCPWRSPHFRLLSHFFAANVNCDGDFGARAVICRGRSDLAAPLLTSGPDVLPYGIGVANTRGIAQTTNAAHEKMCMMTMVITRSVEAKLQRRRVKAVMGQNSTRSWDLEEMAMLGIYIYLSIVGRPAAFHPRVRGSKYDSRHEGRSTGFRVIA